MTSFLAPDSFDPDVTRAMAVAFDRACESLQLADRSSALAALVAARIIATAQNGERDAVRLYEAVMEWTARAA